MKESLRDTTIKMRIPPEFQAVVEGTPGPLFDRSRSSESPVLSVPNQRTNYWICHQCAHVNNSASSPDRCGACPHSKCGSCTLLQYSMQDGRDHALTHRPFGPMTAALPWSQSRLR